MIKIVSIVLGYVSSYLFLSFVGFRFSWILADGLGGSMMRASYAMMGAIFSLAIYWRLSRVRHD